MSLGKEDTKKRIMEVAMELFGNSGYAGTSVRDIAKGADVNVASINYHFESKKNLLKEILWYAHELFADSLKAKVDCSTVKCSEVTLEDACNTIFEVMNDLNMVVRTIFRVLLFDTSEEALEIFADKYGDPNKTPMGEIFLYILNRDYPGIDQSLISDALESLQHLMIIEVLMISSKLSESKKAVEAGCNHVAAKRRVMLACEALKCRLGGLK